MVETIKITLRFFALFTLIFTLFTAFLTEWLLQNISGALFYGIVCVLLLAGALAGGYWMVRKRSLDSLFFPTTLISTPLGIGLLLNREDTVNMFRASDLELIILACLLMGAAAMGAVSLTLGDSPKKRH